MFVLELLVESKGVVLMHFWDTHKLLQTTIHVAMGEFVFEANNTISECLTTDHYTASIFLLLVVTGTDDQLLDRYWLSKLHLLNFWQFKNGLGANLV